MVEDFLPCGSKHACIEYWVHTQCEMTHTTFYSTTCVCCIFHLERRKTCSIEYTSPRLSFLIHFLKMAAINANNGEAQAPAPLVGIGSAITRGMMMYMFMSIVQRFAVQQGYIPDPTGAATSSTGTQTPPPPGSIATAKDMSMKPKGASQSRVKPSCVWNPHTMMDLHVYITDTEKIDPLLECSPANSNLNSVIAEWHEEDLELASLDHSVNARSTNVTIDIPRSVQYNETHIYAHVCLMKKKMPPNEQTIASEKGEAATEESLKKEDVHYHAVELTRYKKRKRMRNEKNLLGNGTETQLDTVQITEASSPLTIASANMKEDTTLLYLKPSLTMQLVDQSGMPGFPHRDAIPPQIDSHMHWLDDVDAENPGGSYYPILYSSEFWITKDGMIEVNDTLVEATIELKFENVKVWKWQLMSQMEETWRKQAEMNGGEEDAGSDIFRTMLLETNPILLAITGIVSVLHTVFDMLAFKNDIKFFNKKKSMEGLSIRSMIINTVFQLIILLYLMDNETSFMVLMSNAVGVAIEMWKISKAVKVSIFDGDGNMAVSWKESETYTKSKTKEYDEIATDHLMFVTMPLVTGYGIYSLCYQKHKGWYSWILNTLVGFIYMFGFVMMTPQLFINYKLQSVAHLNWRTMTYKSINTFIDDLFGKLKVNFLIYDHVTCVSYLLFRGNKDLRIHSFSYLLHLPLRSIRNQDAYYASPGLPKR